MKRLWGSAAVSLALALASGAVAPVLLPAAAVAQERVSLEIFEAELAPYGIWIDHPRWGRVWSPNDLPRDWRPYTTGRWIWTDDNGWYWQADESWGWIPFHYGRWAYDRRDGWIWVPGTVWGPAWVSWRETDDAYGWAPLPPEEEEDVAETDPVYWTFVAPQDFSAPRIYAVRLPPPRVQVIFPRTRFVYRTTVRDRDNRPRGFNRGPDRVVIERRGNTKVEVRAVEPRFLDREIEQRRGPNSAELQRFRERQREESVRIRVRVDDEGARRPGSSRPNAGPDNAGQPRQGDPAPRRGNDDAQQQPARREQRQERQERQQQRQERQEQRQERQRGAEQPPRPDRRGPPPDNAAQPPADQQGSGQQGGQQGTGQQQGSGQQGSGQGSRQPGAGRQQQQPPGPDAGRSPAAPTDAAPQNQPRTAPDNAQPAPREQRQQPQDQRQQRQERQEQRQQRQEERQQRQEQGGRRNQPPPPTNCGGTGQPAC